MCHTDAKPCLCPECGRSVKNDRQLRDHMRVVHAVNADGKKMDYVTKVSSKFRQELTLNAILLVEVPRRFYFRYCRLNA